MDQLGLLDQPDLAELLARMDQPGLTALRERMALPVPMELTVQPAQPDQRDQMA